MDFFFVFLFFVFTAIFKWSAVVQAFHTLENWYMKRIARRILPKILFSFYKNLEYFGIPHQPLSKKELAEFIDALNIQSNHLYAFHPFGNRRNKIEFFTFIEKAASFEVADFSFQFDFKKSIEWNLEKQKNDVLAYVDKIHQIYLFQLLQMECYRELQQAIGLSTSHTHYSYQLPSIYTDYSRPYMPAVESQPLSLEANLIILKDWRDTIYTILQKRRSRQIHKKADFFTLLTWLYVDLEFVEIPECRLLDYLPPITMPSFEAPTNEEVEIALLKANYLTEETKKRKAL